MQITIKTNHIVIATLSLLIFVLGGLFTWTGMSWYQTINLPIITPPHYVFSWAWRIIFLLTTLSIIRIWNSFERNIFFWLIITMFIINALLNTLWSYLFFTQHLMGAACIDSILIEATILALMWLIWPRSPIDSLLLAPYAAWSCFAILLNILIWRIN